MRRFRSGCVQQEPCDRGSSQRGSLPLHRLDQAGVPEHGRDPAGQRHHAPDQPGEDVAGGLRAGRGGVPGYLRGHRFAHPARGCAGRDRGGRGRPGSGERDAGPRLVDAPARHHWCEADRQTATGHHRHRHGTGAHRVPAQGARGRGVAGILRRGCGGADHWRPRHHLQHVPGIRRHCRHVPYRPADPGLPAPDRPRGVAGTAGGNLCQGHRAVGRCTGHRAVRARAGIRPVHGGAQHGRAEQPASAFAGIGLGRARHRRRSQAGQRQGRAGAGPDARWRGDHCRHHQLHQYLQPAQRDCRRLAGTQCQRPWPAAQAVGEVLAGAGFQGGAAVSAGSRAAAGAGKAGLRHRRLRLHHLQRHERCAGPEDPAGNHRARPVFHRGAVGQPQLRWPHPSVCQAGLPGFAAAGDCLCHCRHRALRHRKGCAGRGCRWQRSAAEGHLAQRCRNRRGGEVGGEAGAVPQRLQPDVQRARGAHQQGGAAVRLAPDEHLYPPSAVLGRRAGRRTHAHRSAPAGRAAGQHHHRPPVAVQRDPGFQCCW